MDIQLARLLDEELLFGLAVRFLGVFAVLFVLMVIMYAAGWLFLRFHGAGSTGESGGPAAPGGEPPPVAAPAETGPGAQVPGEVAAAIVLGLSGSAASLSASGLPVAAEVAAAVALALSNRPHARAVPSPSRAASLPGALFEAGGSEEGCSPWKILGRQDALSGNDPWSGWRRTDREPTNREPQS